MKAWREDRIFPPQGKVESGREAEPVLMTAFNAGCGGPAKICRRKRHLPVAVGVNFSDFTARENQTCFALRFR
jgi:hypothetical protein